MQLRALVAATMMVALAPATAVSHDAPMSPAPVSRASTKQEDLAAYRQYLKAQADLLVGMTKVLVTEVRDGNLDAAQSAYAPAHRYLARLAPAAGLLRDLQRRIDARADDFDQREKDPRFIGFHRIEHGLFADRSTVGLADTADQLVRDVRSLREELAQMDAPPAELIERSAHLVRDLADDRPDGADERYSKTDLWDIEAKVDGVHEVLSSLAPQTRARTEVYFGDIRAALEPHKAGCGFKRYDELKADEKTELKRRIAALAEALTAPRGLTAID